MSRVERTLQEIIGKIKSLSDDKDIIRAVCSKILHEDVTDSESFAEHVYYTCANLNERFDSEALTMGLASALGHIPACSIRREKIVSGLYSILDMFMGQFSISLHNLFKTTAKYAVTEISEKFDELGEDDNEDDTDEEESPIKLFIKLLHHIGEQDNKTEEEN